MLQVIRDYYAEEDVDDDARESIADLWKAHRALMRRVEELEAAPEPVEPAAKSVPKLDWWLWPSPFWFTTETDAADGDTGGALGPPSSDGDTWLPACDP